MQRRGAFILIISAGISACSLFHRETPQQKLFDALNRGNGPAATQIWLTMSPEDRLRFNRGEGITPAVPPQEAVKRLTQMTPDEMQGQVASNHRTPAAPCSICPRWLPHNRAHRRRHRQGAKNDWRLGPP